MSILGKGRDSQVSVAKRVTGKWVSLPRTTLVRCSTLTRGALGVLSPQLAHHVQRGSTECAVILMSTGTFSIKSDSLLVVPVPTVAPAQALALPVSRALRTSPVASRKEMMLSWDRSQGRLS